MYMSASLGGGYSIGFYQIGTGTPTSMITPPALPGVLDGDLDFQGGLPYSHALFDVSDEPGVDLLYLFDEGAGIRRFSKELGAWNLEASFANGIRQGTCFLDGADVVCVGTSSTSIYVMRDVGRKMASGTSGSVKHSATANYQFRGLTLAPVP